MVENDGLIVYNKFRYKNSGIAAWETMFPAAMPFFVG